AALRAGGRGIPARRRSAASRGAEARAAGSDETGAGLERVCQRAERNLKAQRTSAASPLDNAAATTAHSAKKVSTAPAACAYSHCVRRASQLSGTTVQFDVA